MSVDDELTTFKTQIDLTAYAIDCGYEIDTRKSSARSKVMRSADDKISIWVNPDGIWMFKSFKDDSVGSIIDFVKRQQAVNLGEIRKLLRPWIGRPSQQMPAVKLGPTIKDHAAVKAAWDDMTLITSTDGKYLVRDRGLHRQIWASPRFATMIRQERHGYHNIAFAHYNQQGLCGYELKNSVFTGFATGGTRAFWCSSNLKAAAAVVITESAIDCLSHAQIMQTNDAVAYLSIAGQLSDFHRDLIRWLLDRRQNITTMEIGTDNDEPGHKMADQLISIIPDRVHTSRILPATGKDWNDGIRPQR